MFSSCPKRSILINSWLWEVVPGVGFLVSSSNDKFFSYFPTPSRDNFPCNGIFFFFSNEELIHCNWIDMKSSSLIIVLMEELCGNHMTFTAFCRVASKCMTYVLKSLLLGVLFLGLKQHFGAHRTVYFVGLHNWPGLAIFHTHNT